MEKKKEEAIILSAGNKIFNLCAQTKTTYLGYDIITDDFIEVKKNECQQLPTYVLTLLKNKGSRVKLAYKLASANCSKISEYIDVTERTVYRELKELGLARGYEFKNKE